MKFSFRNIPLKLIAAAFAFCCAGMPVSAREYGATASGSAFFDRVRFSCEWGYVQSLALGYHYNILSEEGYRIDESYSGFNPYPNGMVILGVGFVPPGDLLSISLHGGYSGIHKDNRIIPATLRMSFFPKRAVNDGMFYFAEAGAGFHVPKTFKTRVSLVTRIGGGYRFALTRRCSIDLSATIMAAESRPPIPNPDGPGYVAEQNIRSNSATYLAASLTIAVNL